MTLQHNQHISKATFTQAAKLFLFLLSLLTPAQANLLSANNIGNFKIVSAEKLDYQDGDSILIGNVKIKLGQYTLSAPKVFIDSNDQGDPYLARFVDGVALDSKGLEISAPEMHIDITNSLFKCFSGPDSFVKTIIKDQTKSAVVLSWYQELNLVSGLAKAYAQDIKINPSDKFLEQIIVVSDDLNIKSNKIEIQTEKNKIKYIDFIDKVTAIDSSQRLETKQLFYFPDQDLIRAEGDVKLAYLNNPKETPAHLFADYIIYERTSKAISAFSNDTEARASIYKEQGFGKSRQIVLYLDGNEKADQAILTGNAYAQFGDKSIVGHEVLFDIKNQEIQTLVGRPKTQILKSSN